MPTFKEISFKVTLNGEELSEAGVEEHTIYINGEIDALEKISFNFLFKLEIINLISSSFLLNAICFSEALIEYKVIITT